MIRDIERWLSGVASAGHRSNPPPKAVTLGLVNSICALKQGVSPSRAGQDSADCLASGPLTVVPNVIHRDTQHGFIKKDKKLPDDDLDLARKRLRDLRK